MESNARAQALASTTGDVRRSATLRPASPAGCWHEGALRSGAPQQSRRRVPGFASRGGVGNVARRTAIGPIALLARRIRTRLAGDISRHIVGLLRRQRFPCSIRHVVPDERGALALARHRGANTEGAWPPHGRNPRVQLLAAGTIRLVARDAVLRVHLGARLPVPREMWKRRQSVRAGKRIAGTHRHTAREPCEVRDHVLHLATGIGKPIPREASREAIVDTIGDPDHRAGTIEISGIANKRAGQRRRLDVPATVQVTVRAADRPGRVRWKAVCGIGEQRQPPADRRTEGVAGDLGIDGRPPRGGVERRAGLTCLDGTLLRCLHATGREKEGREADEGADVQADVRADVKPTNRQT